MSVAQVSKSPSSYYPAEFVRRRKGQRYEKFPVDNLLVDLSKFPHKVTGQFVGSDGWGPGTCMFNAIVVTIDGRQWPCYQKASADRTYIICHNRQYRSVAVVQS